MSALRCTATVAVTLALGAFVFSPQSTTRLESAIRPAVELSTTPTGWVPVAYADAQVSVPSSFLVFYAGQSQACGVGSLGRVFVGAPQAVGAIECPQSPQITVRAQTVVRLIVRQMPPALANEKPVIINGVPVYTGPHSAGAFNDFAPSLHIEVTAQGPMADRVIYTLSRSPRDVALAGGPAPPVPRSWRLVTFAGLRLSAPSAWPVHRTEVTPGLGDICRTPGVALLGKTVTLSTDVRPLQPLPCPYFPPFPQHPTNGVQVDSGLRTEPLVNLTFSARCLELETLTACPASSPAYSILVLRVTEPRRDEPIFVSIGLAANGVVARTILYSLRAE